jgi:hypothetical protein
MKQGNTKKISSNNDIFSRYRTSKFHQYLFSGIFAFVIAFSLVSAREWVNVQQFLASVSQVNQTPISYDADIVLHRRADGMIDIIAGNTLQKVDRLEFTLLGDPMYFRALTSNSEFVEILSESSWVYQVVANLRGQDILPGMSILNLHWDIDPNTHLALVDTDFVSSDTRYQLSNKVEE